MRPKLPCDAQWCDGLGAFLPFFFRGGGGGDSDPPPAQVRTIVLGASSLRLSSGATVSLQVSFARMAMADCPMGAFGCVGGLQVSVGEIQGASLGQNSFRAVAGPYSRRMASCFRGQANMGT